MPMTGRATFGFCDSLFRGWTVVTALKGCRGAFESLSVGTVLYRRCVDFDIRMGWRLMLDLKAFGMPTCQNTIELD